MNITPRKLGSLPAATAACFFVMATSSAPAAEFFAIENLSVNATNRDGSVVVGTVRDKERNADSAVFWRGGVVTSLKLGGRISSASGVSADGSVIVGTVYETLEKSYGFRWSGGTLHRIDVLPGAGKHRSSARAVSANGSIVVGQTESSDGAQAFRWFDGAKSGSGAMRGLGRMGGVETGAVAVSADGSVVVGNVRYPPDARPSMLAFRWILGDPLSAGTMTLLRGARGELTWATGINGDGSVVVGFMEGDTGQREAFRWAGGVIRGLGGLGGRDSEGVAEGISADGNVIVGQAETAGGALEAFRWTPARGMQNIRMLLQSAGVRIEGWFLESAKAVSGDGRVIYGTGRDPAGRNRTWRAVLEP